MGEGQKYQFKSVQIFKDESLGVGAYGAVYKAKCDDLLCAAKIIHPTLVDPTALHQIAIQREHRLPIRRFEQECEFISAIRHPNIVQYLGMYQDTDTHLPVLLMELMDDSLTHFLENSTQPIPYHIQVNICHDVTLALSFLHSNNIIHRDLSSNNVLLHGDILAKVTDFGMAKLSDLNPQASHFTNTMCPGTDVYMPPEAVQDKPVYTEKIDCFSFGVILVQILTREFPKPGDRLQEIELNHPGLQAGTVLVRVLEINRRQNHISKVPPNHSLLPIALDCLKDDDSERPSSHQLCERIADLKGMPEYVDSAKTIDKDEVIQSQAVCMELLEEANQHLRQELQEKDQANKQLEERERQLLQEANKALREGRIRYQESEGQLGHINQQLEASKQVVAQLERQIAELEQQLSQREQQNTKACSRVKKLTSVKQGWREGKKAPYCMYRYCDAVVDGNTIYVRDKGLVKICSYEITSDSWSQLPDCVHVNGSIAIINGWLTTVGGYSYPTYSNELFSLTGEGSGRRWIKKFPPMPTKRYWTTVVCSQTNYKILLVAGGVGEAGILSTVEVMDTENNQWFTAANLPRPMHSASKTICGEEIFMLGGNNKNDIHSKTVYTCSMRTLLQSCVLSSSEANRERTYSAERAGVWRQIAKLPVIRSTCESFHGQLLAIGGLDLGKHSTAIYMYDSTTNSWEIICHMTCGRSRCFSAVLPDNRLIVMGGETNNGRTDTVEFTALSIY